MAKMKISIASDHAGFELKESIKEYLLHYEHDVNDHGCDDTEPVDYPDVSVLATRSVISNNSEFAILVCGSGLGMTIIANKVRGIRACLCHTVEYAQLAREHNDANVLVLAGRFIDTASALEIVHTFLNMPFSDEERHINRVEKIVVYENSLGEQV